MCCAPLVVAGCYNKSLHVRVKRPGPSCDCGLHGYRGDVCASMCMGNAGRGLGELAGSKRRASDDAWGLRGKGGLGQLNSAHEKAGRREMDTNRARGEPGGRIGVARVERRTKLAHAG